MRALRAMAAGVLAAAMIAPAHAAESADPGKPQSIQLQAVALPVVVDNRVVNYVFVTVKLDLALGADGAAVRTKEAFFRDALVRTGHRTPFTLATDYSQVDAARVRLSVLKAAPAILGPGVVRDVEITKQAPQHRLPPVKKGQPQAAAPAQPQGPEIIP